MSPLSPRQLEVAQLVAQGLTDKQIAVALEPCIHPDTVRVYVRGIVKRLGLKRNANVRVLIALHMKAAA